METMKFKVWRNTYDRNPKFLFARKLLTVEVHIGDVLKQDVSEIRPDWGEYSAIPTLPALERYLRKHGMLNVTCAPNEDLSYGFIETPRLSPARS